MQNTAHKNPYKTVDEATQLDLVIVVNQLLTGYDSKWVNTLYLDKSLEYQNIIQAFSRTNRLNGPEKPFGTIRYYRKAHTMEQNIEEAIELYSGKQAKGLFVEKLYNNLEKLNDIFEEIKSVFNISGIENFSHLPEVPGEIKQFVNLYNQLIHCYESAMIQGFTWAKSTYEIQDYEPITVVITEYEFNILAQRYSEIEREPRDGNDSIAYDIDYQLPEGSRSRINYEYLNTNFKKYIVIKEGWEFTDYLNEYQLSEEDDFIQDLVDSTNINEALLREMLDLRLTEVNINEYSRFDKLKSSVNVGHFSGYIEKNLGKMVIPIKVNMLIDRLLRAFLLEDVFDVTEYIKNYFN